MQQATINLFADMGVQPATLQPGLTAAAASSDTTPPSSAPVNPTRTVTAGNAVTVSGTAADSGGGRVGGVEVSVDGGTTWHPANGRESWSYTWTPTASGQVTILSRAADDSGNLEGRDGGSGGQPGGGGTVPPGGGTTSPPPVTGPSVQDEVAPRVQVRPRRVRASRRGRVRLRVRCPRDEQVCRVNLRLRRAGSTVARKRLRVAGGETRRVSLRLNRGARRALARSSSLRVVAVATARDAAGNRATTRTRIRVLAPRRR
jgi:Bacterial Ig domain